LPSSSPSLSALCQDQNASLSFATLPHSLLKPRGVTPLRKFSFLWLQTAHGSRAHRDLTHSSLRAVLLPTLFHLKLTTFTYNSHQPPPQPPPAPQSPVAISPPSHLGLQWRPGEREKPANDSSFPVSSRLGFRYFAQDPAERLHLGGYCANLGRAASKLTRSFRTIASALPVSSKKGPHAQWFRCRGLILRASIRSTKRIQKSRTISNGAGPNG